MILCSHNDIKGLSLLEAKGKSCYLEIQTHGRNPYGVIRTSYREDGKVKHKNIGRLTGLPLEQLKLIKAALQNKAVLQEEFEIHSSREYGASFACATILKELNLHKAIHSHPAQEWVRSACAMIIGRLVYSGSKLSLSTCDAYSSLWEVCGIQGDVDVNTHCYEAMDKLFARQGAIQKSLAKKHLQDGTLVLYDITSCYMEGEYENSGLVTFGYNRDKKRGHEQIVISLLCNKQGCPVATEVFPGNTKDECTILDKISEIRQKYGLERVIFVGDRGMVTQAKYEQLDHETVRVISALNHSNIQKLSDKGVIQMGLFDDNNIIEVIDGDIRYMLCKNPQMQEKEAKTRQALIKKTTDELDKIIASTRKTKNSKAVRAGKIVGKYNMAKFIAFEGSDDNLTYKLDETRIEQEARLDGCYVVFTDVHADDLSAVETVKSYKDLIKVEQAFRNLKTAALEIRPVYHKKDERIQCHVFICMLAYYVMWHMRQRLEPLSDIDGIGHKRRYSFEFIMESLKSIRNDTVRFMGAVTNIISTPNKEQTHILNLLGVVV